MKKEEAEKYAKSVFESAKKFITLEQDSIFDKIRVEIEQLPIADTEISLVTEILDRYKESFQEICDSENSEIKNEVKDLSERVENIEKQIKKDKEEQLEKLRAELDYAKFCCAYSKHKKGGYVFNS